MLIAFSAGTQNAKADTLNVRAYVLSDPKVPSGGQIQFLAQAQYIGNYSYKWLSNGTEIQNATSTIMQNATGSFLTYNSSEVGNFNITCVITDLTGTFDPGTTTPITVTVLPITAVILATPPQGQQSENQLPLQTILIVAIVVIAVIVAATVIVIKQRNSKKTKKP